jgi:hypothetical protein
MLLMANLHSVPALAPALGTVCQSSLALSMHQDQPIADDHKCAVNEAEVAARQPTPVAAGRVQVGWQQLRMRSHSRTSCRGLKVTVLRQVTAAAADSIASGSPGVAARIPTAAVSTAVAASQKALGRHAAGRMPVASLASW